MKLHWQCISPECEAPKQGDTYYCHSCNRARRKEQTLMSKEPKKVKKPRFATPKRSKQLEQYSKVRELFLAEHNKCEFAFCMKKSVDVHHMKGRSCSMLLDDRYFLAVCRDHHEWIELNPIEAIQKGYSFSRLETQNE